MNFNAKAVIVEQFLTLFEELGAQIIDVDILQPAEPFLDSVGEDLRRRIFMTEDENGNSLCLRPEFTIPVCLRYLNEAKKKPGYFAYCGEVFRQSRQTSPAFYQAGIEDFGGSDEALCDARSLCYALTAIKKAKPHQAISVILGDQEIFDAVLQALGLPKVWQRKLLRCFGNREQLIAVMDKLSVPRPAKNLPAPLRVHIANKNVSKLKQAIFAEMRQADISPHAGRKPEDIARRLLEAEELNDLCLTPKQYNMLQQFLDIKVTLAQAQSLLQDYCESNMLDLSKVLTKFHRRNQLLQANGLNLHAITYDAAFGRKLDYYTGLVFEISADGVLLAGGGRYNRLMTMLGAKKTVPAVGFAIWVDRLSPTIWRDGIEGVNR